MKRTLILLVCLLVLSLAACTPQGQIEVVKDADKKPAEQVQNSDNKELMPTPSPKPLQTESMADDMSSEAPVPSVAPPTPSPTPAPSNPRMYTSDAHMVSFDPATGIAEFDYFDKLKGQEAIDWMVSHEGYSVADATDIANNFADSEYCYKNTNPQLRAIDLDDQPLLLMFRPDGSYSFEEEQFPSTTADVASLYALDPACLFDSFDFIIHVDGSGNVTLVEQIFWP